MKRRLITTVLATSVLALSVSSVAVAAPGQQQQNRAKDGTCTAAATQSCDQTQQRLNDGTGTGSQSRAQNGQKATATKRARSGNKQAGSQSLNRVGSGLQVRDGSCR